MLQGFGKRGGDDGGGEGEWKGRYRRGVTSGFTDYKDLGKDRADYIKSQFPTNFLSHNQYLSSTLLSVTYKGSHH